MRPAHAFALAAVCLTAPVSQAGTAVGMFQVHIRLNGPNDSGVCVSSSLSQQTHALVKVTCSGSQFVSIEPQLGKPFVGTHGGAFRFAFTNGVGATNGSGLESDGSIGAGTVTALRVLNLAEGDKGLELLVSF